MRKLLALLFLLAPLCAHAQFAKIQGGPLVGNCNPHTLGMDFVNNNIYECDGEPVPQWKLVGGINNQGIIPVLLRTNSPNCTTTNQLVQYDPGQIDSAGIGEVTNAAISSTGVIGVVISGAGCSGIATIATYLSAQCITDNQSTVGDLVSPSTTVPGQCHDYGSSLATGVQTVGRVSKANTGQGTASQVDFFLGNQLASGSTGVGTVSNCGTPGGIAYYVTAGNVVGCDPNFTTDGSGNWASHSGTVNDTSHAGYINYIQGAAPPTAPTNGVQLTVPTSVTGYSLYLPGTKPTSGDCANWSAIAGQIQITDSGSPCGGSGGGVSTFSSGNLSPLFTTSVATPTTTPALSFSLSTASANTFYGNVNNSTNVPSFNTLPSCANDGVHALTYTQGTGLICAVISGTGGSTTLTNPSAPTLANQNAAGARTICYEIVGLEDGITGSFHSAASGQTCISNANASPQVKLTAYGDTITDYRCFAIYVISDTGVRTTGKIQSCAWKSFIDTGGAGDGTSPPATNSTAVWTNPRPLPGCNIELGAVGDVDHEPCTPNAMDDEFTWGDGTIVPGDANDPFWTVVNQGSCTFSMTAGMFSMSCPSRSSNGNPSQVNCIFQPAPSTPYKFVDLQYIHPITNGTLEAGMAFRESATGKIEMVAPYRDTAHFTGVLVTKWTSATALSSIAVNGSTGEALGGLNLELQNDGTNITEYSSTDGVTYAQQFQEGKAAFFTTAPDQVGVCLDSANQIGKADWKYFRRTQ